MHLLPFSNIHNEKYAHFYNFGLWFYFRKALRFFAFRLQLSAETKVRSNVAYVDTSKMHQSRNDTLNAVQQLFTRKFILEMT